MSFKVLQQLIVLGLSIGIVFLFIQPKFHELRELQVETTEYASAVARATEFNQLLSSLLNEIDAISQRDLEALETFLPLEINPIVVSRDLEQIATDNGMIINSITLREAEDANSTNRRLTSPTYAQDTATASSSASNAAYGQQLLTQQFDMSVTGSYASFKAFMRGIEANQYPLRVVSLSVGDVNSATAVSGNNAFISYTVTVETYSWNPSL